MRYSAKKIIRLLLSVFFILVVMAAPLILFLAGTKESGVILNNKIFSELTFNSFHNLFCGQGYPNILFRQGLLRSIYYSFFVASMCTFFSFFYSNWIAGWPRKSGIKLSFVLLTLTLLPQTYLIMPVLAVISKASVKPSEDVLIIWVLFMGYLPLGAWMLYMISGGKIKELQENCALDFLAPISTVKTIIKEIKIDLFVVFLVIWSISWGNYLIPFSLGSNHSFTATVQVATFTTNLGRDWAMSCAAGLIIALPGILVGLAVGIYNAFIFFNTGRCK